MTSIMDMFRNAPVQPAPQNAGVQPNQAGPGGMSTNIADPTKVSAGTAANGAVPADGTNAAGNTAPAEPLSTFTKLWETPAPVEGAQQPLSGLKVDSTKLMEAARRMDFSSTITPEMKAAIAAGGEGAVAAMVAAMQTVGQDAFGQAALVSTQLIDRAVESHNKNLELRLPDLIKKHAVSESLAKEIPALSSPAAAPLIESLKSQLQVKHPTATAAEITELAKQYVSEFAKAVTPAPVVSASETAASKGGDFTDWA